MTFTAKVYTKKQPKIDKDGSLRNNFLAKRYNIIYLGANYGSEEISLKYKDYYQIEGKNRTRYIFINLDEKPCLDYFPRFNGEWIRRKDKNNLNLLKNISNIVDYRKDCLIANQKLFEMDQFHKKYGLSIKDDLDKKFHNLVDLLRLTEGTETYLSMLSTIHEDNIPTINAIANALAKQYVGHVWNSETGFKKTNTEDIFKLYKTKIEEKRKEENEEIRKRNETTKKLKEKKRLEWLASQPFRIVE